MTKPAAGAGAQEEEDVQVLVERPYSHEGEGEGPPPPPLPNQQVVIRARPYYRRWSPWLVSTFAAACVALFLVTMYANDCPKHNTNCAAGFLGRFAFQPLRENPLLGPSSATLVRLGALDVSKVVHGRQWWRLLTCMWLHAGLVHLLLNMLCLLFIGVRLEQEFGFARVGAVYLVSGLGGSLLSALFLRASVSVGASGALFGLVGSMLSELITNWSLYANKVAALASLVAVIAVNLALGLLPRVDNFAHIGGLLAGFLLGFVLLIRPHFAWLNNHQNHNQRRVAAAGEAAPPPPGAEAGRRRNRKHRTYQYVLWVAAAALLVAGFTVATVLLFRGYDANAHCGWCRYLSCVPTRRWRCDAATTVCTPTPREDGTLTVLCDGGAGRNRTYDVPGGAGASQERINDLCNQMCV